MLQITIDIVMIALLILTIGFSWRLNNKIIEIRGSRQDLVALVKTLDTAIIKTNKNIADLKMMSANSTTELQSYVEKARELLADLSFMTETASHLADRVERGLVNLRKTNDNIASSGFSEKIDRLISDISTNDNDSKFTINENPYNKTKQELLNRLKTTRGA